MACKMGTVFKQRQGGWPGSAARCVVNFCLMEGGEPFKNEIGILFDIGAAEQKNFLPSGLEKTPDDFSPMAGGPAFGRYIAPEPER